MKLPPPTLPRRDVLSRALLAAAASTLPMLASSPALAVMYTIVPSGSIAEKRGRLAEVEKLFAKTPDDPYVFGEKAQLESDIKMLSQNSDFAKKAASGVASGKMTLATSFRFPVPDMNEALTFWTLGVGAKVASTKLDADGSNVTRISFGPQSLQPEDGAKFALELVQPAGGKRVAFNPEGSMLQYLQLAMPVFRLSQVMANGGEIVSAYGWTECVAPGGLPLRVRIDESRRDPFEFIALRTSDVKAATNHWKGLGMSVVKETNSKKEYKLGGSNFIYQKSVDAFEPDREPGTIQLGFNIEGDLKNAELSTGVLLLPPKARRDPLSLGTPPISLTLIGSPPAGAATTTPDGLNCEYLSADAFEAMVR